MPTRQLLADLLTRIEQGRTRKEMGQALGISAEHYGSIKNGIKPCTIEIIDLLCSQNPAAYEMRDQLLSAAGHQPDELDRAAINLHALLTDKLLSSEQHDLISDTTRDFIVCWYHYVGAKRAQYARAWTEAIRHSDEGLQQLEAITLRLQTYLLDTKAAVELHRANLDSVAHLHEQIHDLQHLDTHAFPEDKHSAKPESADVYIRALNLLHQGDYLREIGQWTQSQDAYERAAYLFTTIKRQHEVARCDRKLAIIQLYRGDWYHAQETLEDCRNRFLELAKSDPHALYEVAKTDFTIGWAYNLAGKYEEAHQAHERGCAFAETYRTKDGKQDEYLTMLGHSYQANDLRQFGQYQGAIDFYNKALKLAEELSDDRAKGWIYLGLGRSYFSQAKRAENPAEREEYTHQASEGFERALEILRKQRQYRYRYAMTLIHAASFSLYRKKKAQAQNMLVSALRITQDLSSHYYEAAALVGLGELYRTERDYAALETTAKSVRALDERYHYHNHVARLNAIEAKACLDQYKPGQSKSASANRYLHAAGEYYAAALGSALNFNQFLVSEIEHDLSTSLDTLTRQRTRNAHAAYHLLTTIQGVLEQQCEGAAVYNSTTYQQWQAVIERIVQLRKRYA